MQNWLRNSPGERYKRLQICVTGEVETLSSPIRRQNSGCEHMGGMVAADWKWRQPSGKFFAAEWNVASAGWKVVASGWKVRGSRVEFLPGWNEQDPILLVF